jgi:8-oxo-dGTP pyrophosphatase MutT (NUDIX family)
MKEDAQFYVCQKAFIDKDGDVLVLNDPIEGLDFPGGKIQIGEKNFIEALKREVREETGLEIEVGVPFQTWRGDYPDNHRNAGKIVYIVAFRCKYISGEVALSNEHDKYYWINRQNYREVNDGSTFFEALENYFI